MRAVILFTTLFFAVTVSSSYIRVERSKVSLPLSRRLNVTSAFNLVQHDQARARALKIMGAARQAGLEIRASDETPVTNEGVTYIATVGVGSPPTTYDLIVDTGSSNTWVGAGKPYVVTSTSTKTSESVAVSYGSGNFSGTEYTDEVQLSQGLVIKRQSIGVASEASGFEGVDGILGIGPVDLTIGTLSPAILSPIPTVTDNLYLDDDISTESIGVFFNPVTSDLGGEGSINWGESNSQKSCGPDSSKLTGKINYTPVTLVPPASQFWGIEQSLQYGDSVILETTVGIVDTGTTLILLASDAFSKYQTETGAELDENTGLLQITNAQYGNLKSLFFVVGSNQYELIPDAQIWPRSLNTALGGLDSVVYLIVNSLGTPSGQGLDFINGFAFLERYYSVYDTSQRQVGFATTRYTNAKVNY